MTVWHSSPCRLACFDVRTLREHARRFIAMATLLGSAAALAQNATSATPPAAPPAMSTATVVQRDTPIWSEYHGTVAARNSVQLIALVTGRIKAVHASAGQRVRKGQVLVELEMNDMEPAR